jgi:hypothetical protein
MGQMEVGNSNRSSQGNHLVIDRRLMHSTQDFQSVRMPLDNIMPSTSTGQLPRMSETVGTGRQATWQIECRGYLLKRAYAERSCSGIS